MNLSSTHREFPWRHLSEWPILAEHRWPHIGRTLTDAQRYDLFLCANWVYIMSGAAGTTMRYPQGFFEDPMYDGQLAISRFASRIPWNRFAARPAEEIISTDREDILVTALADDRLLIAWFYHNVDFAERENIQLAVTFQVSREQPSEILWIDTQTGNTIRRERAPVMPYTISTPRFKGHIACIVRATK